MRWPRPSCRRRRARLWVSDIPPSDRYDPSIALPSLYGTGPPSPPAARGVRTAAADRFAVARGDAFAGPRPVVAGGAVAGADPVVRSWVAQAAGRVRASSVSA